MEISVQEYQKLKEEEKDHLLVDVRETQEREYCSIQPSVHLPLSGFGENFKALEKSGKLVIYCHHGMRSLQAAKFLNERGYLNVLSLAGGIDAWSVAIDPNVPRY